MNNLAVIPRDWNYPIREYRSSLENPSSPLSFPSEWLLDIFNGGRTDSGLRVSELTAFQTVAFLACVDIIAGKIASLPIHVYERTLSKTGRAIHRVAYEHDYYELIHTEPNEEMSRQTFLKAYLCHALAWGNAYAEIQRDASTNVVAIWPRNPAKTSVRRLAVTQYLAAVPWRPYPLTIAAGTLVYETSDGNDPSYTDALKADRPLRIIPVEDMLHVPGLAFDGRVGQSVVWLARQTIGLALATEKFGAKYFANFARPGGILELPMNLTDPQKNNARNSWMEAQGGENSNRVAVMPPGFKWTSISNNPQEGQTIETRAYVRNDIASLFHVPVRMVGDTSKSSRASTEQENQEFLDYALQPWISAFKLEVKRKLFGHPGVGRRPRNPYYVDFDTSEMVRGDAASREKFYASGKQWGYLNTNDVRGMEKLNPIEEPWAEEYWIPVNMTLSTTPINPGTQDGAGNGFPNKGSKKSLSSAFRMAIGRLSDRSVRNVESFNEDFGPFLSLCREFAIRMADDEFGIHLDSLKETDRFIGEYLGSMEKRGAEWAVDQSREIEVEEVQRAIRSIRVSVYREYATAKAKMENQEEA